MTSQTKTTNTYTLAGGNMNAPKRVSNTVRRKVTPSSPTVHALLRHLHKKGIDWVN